MVGTAGERTQNVINHPVGPIAMQGITTPGAGGGAGKTFGKIEAIMPNSATYTIPRLLGYSVNSYTLREMVCCRFVHTGLGLDAVWSNRSVVSAISTGSDHHIHRIRGLGEDPW